LMQAVGALNYLGVPFMARPAVPAYVAPPYQPPLPPPAQQQQPAPPRKRRRT
jgi:hypothetical protein